jgi:nucleotide-binding universal stress UspA family protein
MAAVDGAGPQPQTIDLAAAEAMRRGAALLVVHAWPGRYATRGSISTEEDGRHLLDIAARRARHRQPDLEVTTALLDGGAATALTRQSAHGQLLVVGHRDDVRSGQGWGSTAAYLAHHSACPLLVHRGTIAEHGPIVVAVSGGDAGEDTVRRAFEEAEWCGEQLVAVHVWSHGTDRAEADRRLATALTRSAATHPSVVVERLVLRDLDVAYAVQRTAQRGRLLVAGMGHHGRFAESLYGSLAPSPARRSAGPVLLVPASPATVPSKGADRP